MNKIEVDFASMSSLASLAGQTNKYSEILEIICRPVTVRMLYYDKTVILPKVKYGKSSIMNELKFATNTQLEKDDFFQSWFKLKIDLYAKDPANYIQKVANLLLSNNNYKDVHFQLIYNGNQQNWALEIKNAIIQMYKRCRWCSEVGPESNTCIHCNQEL